MQCDLPWSGDEGYQKAEVTGGGVSLSEINPRTMESRRYPGLLLAGLEAGSSPAIKAAIGMILKPRSPTVTLVPLTEWVSALAPDTLKQNT